ncbi:hypothetical protein [Aliiruegeria lutimaris]|uniref:Uncharacterized protein n=1 Tax=Aliiruegeria lutimaris TaxID=571298 RepID=A0A1G9LR47_9RHOB|nr:hypothetical protein [Aliiruegeria lutimaris]SDL64284.1 hypothetical protein SAMN04488026_110011 [Aliiruegeria lutimaris]
MSADQSLTLIDYAVAAPAFGLDMARLDADFADWRRRRAVYRKTLRELEPLSPRHFAELRMRSAEFHYIAVHSAKRA